MSKYTAIIVEDMPQAMQMLEADIEQYLPEVKVSGKATSIVNAAKLLRQEQPDVLFLDITLGDGSAFDLLEIFPNLTSKVIFITASDEHAIKAFRFSAIDYLLKPIDSKLLIEAFEKVKSIKTMKQTGIDVLKEAIKSPDKLPTRISLHSHEKISVHLISEIVRCESDGNNTWFFMISGEKLYVTKTLKHFEELLKDHQFVRVHQSHLINFSFINEFSKKDGGFIKLKNGHEVPVSVRKKPEIMDMLDGMV